MKMLYFDVIGGISGDMTVAALLDLGVSLEALKKELTKLRLGGYRLSRRRVQRGHQQAVAFNVSTNNKKNYTYRQIVSLVGSSRLSLGVKKNILKVYGVLRDAEKKVHGHAHGDLRFHQLGEVDSIIDVAATCICLEQLKVEKILYSVLPLGLKVAPAVAQMLLDQKVTFTQWPFENITPTGMACLVALGKQLFEVPSSSWIHGRFGTGAGKRDSLETDNVLRVLELAPVEQKDDGHGVLVIETNIDDMNPQVFDYLFDRLLAAGALDVFVQHAIMKKSRPGFLLTVLSSAQNFDKITEIILRETTTLGVRYYLVGRRTLGRRVVTTKLRGHAVRIKRSVLPDGGLRLTPEYEDCRRVASQTGYPLIQVIEESKRKV